MDNTHVSVTTKFKLPDAIASFAGQINDTDGHEAMPIKRWADVYGNEVKPLADALLNAANEGQAPTQLQPAMEWLLIKPFDPGELMRAIDAVVHDKQL